MNRRWFPYLTVLLLLGLLALLATLQYRWLGQISDAESVRLDKRVNDDTNRFAREFDQEIQKASFALQIAASEFENGDLRGIQKRFAFWKQQTSDPELIQSIYYLRANDTAGLKKIDLKTGKMFDSDWPADLAVARKKIDASQAAMEVVGNAIVIPLFGKNDELQRIVIRRKTSGREDEVVQERKIGGPPHHEGFLIVELNREVIKTRLLPRLVAKYFSQDSAGTYDVAVTDETGNAVFSTTGKPFVSGDASVRFFGLMPNDFAFFSGRTADIGPGEAPAKKSEVMLSETRNKQTVADAQGKVLSVDLKGPGEESPQISVFEREQVDRNGQWLLTVRHAEGSLETFITNTRNRNLAISFGILTVLAAGMVLIAIYAIRAKALAKRQLEFVSSVSHEFRTPLAVIYSAGENISDGVIEDGEKLYSYGEMIKREGAKLSAMVEQVLEYAGASSGGRTYEFKHEQIADVIDSAIEECAPVIREKGFEVEKDIEGGLPAVMIDKRALVQAIQNLIANGLKYSNGSFWMKVSACRENGNIKISVEDRGIGIETGDLKNLFEPFFRSPKVVDEQISGNGLGLSLVKEIVTAHKGRVSVTSTPGAGSVFTITIPIVDQVFPPQ